MIKLLLKFKACKVKLNPKKQKKKKVCSHTKNIRDRHSMKLKNLCAEINTSRET